MLSAVGKIKVSPGRISCDLSYDFGRYYQSLIYKQFPNLIGGLFLPRHGCHITLAQPNFHKIDQNVANRYDGVLVEFSYNPETIRIGGLKQGFVGFYMDIHSKHLGKIKRHVVTKFLTRDEGLHLTICSSKHTHKKNDSRILENGTKCSS